MTEDIFEFWSNIKPTDNIHPADRGVFDRIDGQHGFRLDCLPNCFMGPLRDAPIVLLFLSPGFHEDDPRHAKKKAGQEFYARQRSGDEPLPCADEYPAAFEWWESRVRHLTECDDWRFLKDKVSILNIAAYKSPAFNDHPLLASLPSSRCCLAWAQGVLFRDAIKGKRMVVCLRAARWWGLQAGKNINTLYAPNVVPAGFMVHDEMRREIVKETRQRL